MRNLYFLVLILLVVSQSLLAQTVSSNAWSIDSSIETVPHCQNSSADSDNDGWGWENAQSCIVQGSKADFERTQHPVCSSFNSDPDGDGWGWENGVSCIVEETEEGSEVSSNTTTNSNSANSDISETEVLETKYVKFSGEDSSEVIAEFELLEAGPAFIEFGFEPDNLEFRGSVAKNSLTYHRQRLHDLIPGEKYYFVINSDGLRSEINSFVAPGLGEGVATAPEVAISENQENEPELSAAQSSTGESSENLKSYYGTGMIGWSLHNMRIDANNIAGFKIFPSKTGELLSFKTWFKHEVLSGKSYSKGTGGNIKITLRRANRSNTEPTDEILATTYFKPKLQNIPSGQGHDHNISFSTVSFPNPATMVAGERYFLVMENIDSNPGSNYISVNGIIMGTKNGKDEAGFGLDNWNSREGKTNGTWDQRFYHVPVMQLNIDTDNNGSSDHVEGNGYINTVSYKESSRIQFKRSITGSNRVGQSMSPRSDVTLDSLKLYMGREKGSQPLIVEIKERNNVLERISIPANDVPVCGATDVFCQKWLYKKLSKQITLEAGRDYFLELSTGNSSTYATWPLREGTTHSQGKFAQGTVFQDGYAQFSKDGGSSWEGFKFWSVEDRKDTDLPFWFNTVE